MAALHELEILCIGLDQNLHCEGRKPAQRMASSGSAGLCSVLRASLPPGSIERGMADTDAQDDPADVYRLWLL